MKTNMVIIPPTNKRKQTYPVPWFHAIQKSDIKIFNMDCCSKIVKKRLKKYNIGCTRVYYLSQL
uniref:Uncharacterized protein n=1 Tax=Arundo donax TaxID=35708 RepID=A0A0A9CR88_ARUDO